MTIGLSSESLDRDQFIYFLSFTKIMNKKLETKLHKLTKSLAKIHIKTQLIPKHHFVQKKNKKGEKYPVKIITTHKILIE